MQPPKREDMGIDGRVYPVGTKPKEAAAKGKQGETDHMFAEDSLPDPGEADRQGRPPRHRPVRGGHGKREPPPRLFRLFRLWEEVREAERVLQAGGSANPRIENTLRRILDNYFRHFGAIDYKKERDKFDGQDKVICNSLLSLLDAESHSAFDDAHITPSDTMTRTALRVFKEIFEKSGHGAHYEMMNPPSPTPVGVAP